MSTLLLGCPASSYGAMGNFINNPLAISWACLQFYFLLLYPKQFLKGLKYVSFEKFLWTFYIVQNIILGNISINLNNETFIYYALDTVLSQTPVSHMNYVSVLSIYRQCS